CVSESGACCHQAFISIEHQLASSAAPRSSDTLNKPSAGTGSWTNSGCRIVFAICHLVISLKSPQEGVEPRDEILGMARVDARRVDARNQYDAVTNGMQRKTLR